jgi:transcriptional regulator with XRE-family HTH domain
MNLHEVGKKIAELRKAKGFTQEDLAKRCKTNTWTIKRIEEGEVSPKLFVLKQIGEELGYDIPFDDEDDSKVWLLTLHLTNFFFVPLFPWLVWKYKKDEIKELGNHTKDVINFQFSLLIYIAVAISLLFFSITYGLMLFLLIVLFVTVITTLNAVRVIMEKDYIYPFSVKFLKNNL